MSFITKDSEESPRFDPDAIRIRVSTHFRTKWMQKWGWDQHDVREALRDAYRIGQAGKGKWEIYVRKKGEKKLVIGYDPETEEVHVITGAEG